MCSSSQPDLIQEIEPKVEGGARLWYMPNFVKHQFYRFDLLQPLAFNYLENQIARSTGLIRFVSTHMVFSWQLCTILHLYIY